MLRVLVAIALAAGQPASALTLEMRVFDGPIEVTAESRVTVFPAAARTGALARCRPHGRSISLRVAAGFYDAQVIRERDGRVLAIRWAERLTVMAYPDEAGRHLEVINLQAGFGALQVRARSGPPPHVSLYAAGVRDKEAATPVPGDGYTLFVVRAGTYDVLVGDAAPSWHTDVEIPAGGTRLWMPR
jgi:hypothetical protein